MECYRENSSLIMSGGVRRGLEGVRACYQQLNRELPNARYTYKAVIVEQDVGLLEWSADFDTHVVTDGVDSYVIGDGYMKRPPSGALPNRPEWPGGPGALEAHLDGDGGEGSLSPLTADRGSSLGSETQARDGWAGHRPSRGGRPEVCPARSTQKNKVTSNASVNWLPRVPSS